MQIEYHTLESRILAESRAEFSRSISADSWRVSAARDMAVIFIAVEELIRYLIGRQRERVSMLLIFYEFQLIIFWGCCATLRKYTYISVLCRGKGKDTLAVHRHGKVEVRKEIFWIYLTSITRISLIWSLGSPRKISLFILLLSETITPGGA